MVAAVVLFGVSLCGRPMVNTAMLSCPDYNGSNRLVGKAEQSSVYGANSWRGPAGLALDSSMLTIVHTASADPNPWWMLDTEKETEFGTVVVYNRNDSPTEPRRCEMRLFGTQPRTVSGPPGCPKESFADFLARGPYDKADEGALVGVAAAPCVKGSVCEMELCGKITVPTESGEQFVECHGRKGRYLVLQLPGKSRMINLREIVACSHTENTPNQGYTPTTAKLVTTDDRQAKMDRQRRRQVARKNRAKRMKR